MGADIELARPAGPEEAERFEAVTDTALAHLSLDALLAELANRVCAILSADTAAVLLVEGDALVLRATHGLPATLERDVRIRMEGFAGRIVSSKRPLIVADVVPDDHVDPVLHERGVRSLLGVPILFED